MATCHATMTFTRRDQSRFTLALYKKCIAKAQEYVNRYNNTHTGELKLGVGFSKKWLSTELVVTIECPYPDNVMRTVLSDMVQHINLIKGVLFAQSTDQVRWIRLR